MRLAGCKASYRHVVKCASQPRVLIRSLQTSSNQGYGGPSANALSDHYNFDLPPANPHAREIAILGGGLTGLATAFYLNRELPKAKITIYEKSKRLGGWVDSELVKVDDGEVLFEWGPRTIRSGRKPAPMTMIELVCELGLAHDLVGVSKSTPAARNRYIYYPDRLVKLPSRWKGSSLAEVFGDLRALSTEPVFDGQWGLVKEPFVPVRDEDVKDESLGDFISRRFGKKLTDNLVSAVYHGIFAGDIYKLSARTLLPLLWHLETRDPKDGSGILLELFTDMLTRRKIGSAGILEHAKRMVVSKRSRDSYLRRLPNVGMFGNLSVYTFKKGLSQLTSALEEHVRKIKNITVMESSAVDEVNTIKGRSQLQVWSSKPNKNPVASNFDYVISTLGPQHMKHLFLSNTARDPTGGSTDNRVAAACDHSNVSVNVMVVNLYYSNPNLLPVEGFGYLIPRSVPIEQNPERALGVIFSSETSGQRHPMHLPSKYPFYLQVIWNEEQNRPELQGAPPAYEGPEFVAQDTAPGTKLTVMMGGHWWNDWAESDLPSEAQAIEMAQTLLKRHLNIDEQPAAAKARLNRNCIPQYPVGYPQDMATIHDALSSAYQGRLKVAGPWWQGSPGVNDCVRSAQETAGSIRDQKDQSTGLQGYMHESWFVVHTPTGQGKLEYTK